MAVQTGLRMPGVGAISTRCANRECSYSCASAQAQQTRVKALFTLNICSIHLHCYICFNFRCAIFTLLGSEISNYVIYLNSRTHVGRNIFILNML
ncbi:hypothetical protein Plhal304r1_c002g0006561 [Plasmopara halstedii]